MESTQTVEKLGKCQVCGFAGMLGARLKIDATDLSAATQETSDSLPMQWACMTCRATPAGFESDNQLHERLADEEYLGNVK